MITQPLVELVLRGAVIVPASLYALGLLICNINAAFYGPITLRIADAQYVLVGLLWFSLLFLGYAVFDSLRALDGHCKPRDGRMWWQLLARTLICGVGFYVLFSLYSLFTYTLFPDPYMRPVGTLVTLVVMMFTCWVIRRLVVETLSEFQKRRQPTDGVLAAFQRLDLFELCKRIVAVVTAVVLYTVYVYPHANAAFGGGRVRPAMIGLRADKRSVLDKQHSVSVDKQGKIRGVQIVADTADSYVVVPVLRSWDSSDRPCLLIRKEFVEVVVYGE